jgi:DNA-binding FadR family transcriptional regulator
MSFHGPGEFMGPQLFFSVRHGLQQFQSLHDRGEEVIEQVSKEHSEIIAALRQHDPDKVEMAVSRHLLNAEERTKKALLEMAGA